MAELLKNELTIDVKEGMVYSQRVIQDKQELNDFIDLVNKTEEDLTFMKAFVRDFEKAKTEQRQVLKLEAAKKRQLKDFEKQWETHELGMQSQRKMFEQRDIPNIESEIDILREARDKAVLAVESGKK